MKLESVYLFISYSSNNADSKLLLHKQDFFETKKKRKKKRNAVELSVKRPHWNWDYCTDQIILEGAW